MAVSVLEERRAMGRDGVGCETQAEYLPFTLASYVSIYYFLKNHEILFVCPDLRLGQDLIILYILNGEDIITN